MTEFMDNLKTEVSAEILRREEDLLALLKLQQAIDPPKPKRKYKKREGTLRAGSGAKRGPGRPRKQTSLVITDGLGP